jgi:hypothetical protein
VITLKNITVVGSSFIGLNDAYLEDIILLFSIDSRIIYLIIVFEQKSIML